MDFIVDKVSEDCFYENLFIGLPKVLENLPSVGEISLERFPAVQYSTVCGWEQKHGVLLPEDLRAFYNSTNGLLYTYNFTFEEENDEDKIFGRIHINSLNNLVPIYGFEITGDPGVNMKSSNYELRLGAESKIFELVNLYNIGRVTLVYLHHRYLPTIWMHNNNMQFYFLADDFTTYLRMSIHHLGIPMWEFAFTPEGVPEWTEMLFRLLAPSVLLSHKRIEEMRRNDRNKFNENYTEFPLNRIDPLIVKTRIPQNNEVSVTEVNQVKKKQGKTKTQTHNKVQKKVPTQKK